MDAEFSLIPKSAAGGCPCLGWSTNPFFVSVFAFVFVFGFVFVFVLFSLISYALMTCKRHQQTTLIDLGGLFKVEMVFVHLVPVWSE